MTQPQVSDHIRQPEPILQAGDQRAARLLTLKRQTRSVQHACAATGSMPGDRDPTDLDPAPAPATTNDRAAGSSHRGDQPINVVCADLNLLHVSETL
jgi:hypothetical protein